MNIQTDVATEEVSLARQKVSDHFTQWSQYDTESKRSELIKLLTDHSEIVAEGFEMLKSLSDDDVSFATGRPVDAVTKQMLLYRSASVEDLVDNVLKQAKSSSDQEIDDLINVLSMGLSYKP